MRENLKKYGDKGIVADDSHNVTRYSLKLSSYIVADNHDRGVPAIFMISQHVIRDTTMLMARVRKESKRDNQNIGIRSQAARLIHPKFRPKCFMSDMAPAHYNGFIDGMSFDEDTGEIDEERRDFVLNDTKRLYCDFHVRQVPI